MGSFQSCPWPGSYPRKRSDSKVRMEQIEAEDLLKMLLEDSAKPATATLGGLE
jgi:hypothetical protein